MKKIIILLMAVSIMLTSCGKSAGLSNGGKKADNKTPVASPSPKPQPQKDNETVNKTPVPSPSPKPQPQKIDNDNIEQSWIDYAKDHLAIISISVIIIAIVAGSVFVVKKGNPINYFKNNNQPEPNNEKEDQSQSSEEKEDQQPEPDNPPPKILKSLPKPSEDFEFEGSIEFFLGVISGKVTSYYIDWYSYSASDLIFIYNLEGIPSVIQNNIKETLISLDYDISTLK